MVDISDSSEGNANLGFVQEEHSSEDGNSSKKHQRDACENESLSKHATDAPNYNGLIYAIEDSPPWHLTLLLGIQHFLTMVGATISIPFIITPALCIASDNPVRMTFIGTIIFVSGMVTLLQATVGTRLPIIQGGTFSFLIPTLALLESRFPPCESLNFSNLTSEEQNHEFLIRIRQVQGNIAVASFFQVIIGCTGLVGLCLSYITPLTIVPTISLIGLALFDVAAEKASSDWLISSMTIALLILFSQFLPRKNVPVPAYSKDKGCHARWFPVFELFPVLLTIVIAWLVCAVATASDAFAEDSLSRTDRQMSILYDSPWFYVPYPFQWGMPTVSLGGFLGILAGVIVSMIESIGDYYACARLSGAPPPPIHAINRGICIEGIGCVLAGIWGSGNGTTSYSENIGAIRITKVGSRRVIQVAGAAMMLAGIAGKFCALFVTIPDPVVGGLFIVLFSMITAVGLSNLQMVDLNSSRNLFVLGFSLFLGLALPSWMKKNKGSFDTGSEEFNQIITILLSTSMFVGGVTALILDNAIPGTRQEKGIDKWNQQLQSPAEKRKEGQSPYDLPFGMQAIKRWPKCSRVPISPTFVHCLSERQRERMDALLQRIKLPFTSLFRRKEA